MKIPYCEFQKCKIFIRHLRTSLISSLKTPKRLDDLIPGIKHSTINTIGVHPSDGCKIHRHHCLLVATLEYSRFYNFAINSLTHLLKELFFFLMLVKLIDEI